VVLGRDEFDIDELAGELAQGEHRLQAGNASSADEDMEITTHRIDSVVDARRGRHSEKPEVFYELIERMYPERSKLELFARRRRPGWSAWGNEVDA